MIPIPTTVEEAVNQGLATYIAGGTDLRPLMNYSLKKTAQLVFLHRIQELQGIRIDGNTLDIGATVTLRHLAEDTRVRALLPALCQAAGATASPQIRNMGTVGGNLLQDRRCVYFNQPEDWRKSLSPCFKTGGGVCHQIRNSPVCRALYYSDLATALMIYEAIAEIEENGVRTSLPLSELIDRHILANGYGEQDRLPLLLCRIKVALPDKGEVSGFYKYSLRGSIDFPLINFALRCGEKTLIAVGAVARRPLLLPQTAQVWANAEADNDTIIACCEQELKKLAEPIREAVVPVVQKKTAYRLINQLLHLR